MRREITRGAMAALYGEKTYRLMRLIYLTSMADSIGSLYLFKFSNLEMHEHFMRKWVKLRDIIIKEYGEVRI